MKHRIRLGLLSILLLISLLGGCTLPDLGTGGGTTAAQTGANSPTVSLSEAASMPFAVHFVDVGQADCALVVCDGKAMLIDGGNAADSNVVYTYLRKQGISTLECLVATHAHEDHVGGLSGAFLAATVKKVYCPVTDYDTKAFRNFAAKAKAQGLDLTAPEVGESFSLGSATVTVLGPMRDYEDVNDTSIVLRVVYGETSFLFTGDMEQIAETDLVESGATLRSTVLKVGHHGSYSSTSYRFLRAVAPTYAVIPVGKDNDYGHPHTDPLSRLRDADVTLFRTDLHGDVICGSDGKDVFFATAKTPQTAVNPTEHDRTPSASAAATGYTHIGNVESRVFHKPSCSSVPAADNRIYFITRAQAVYAGYTPCGKCKP